MTEDEKNDMKKLAGGAAGLIAGGVAVGAILTTAGIATPLAAYVVYAGAAYGAKKGYDNPDSIVFPFLAGIKNLLGS